MVSLFRQDGGVAQGCPGSGWLFAVTFDAPLRMMSAEVEGRGFLRACADDVAAACANVCVVSALATPLAMIARDRARCQRRQNCVRAGRPGGRRGDRHGGDARMAAARGAAARGSGGPSGGARPSGLARRVAHGAPCSPSGKRVCGALPMQAWPPTCRPASTMRRPWPSLVMCRSWRRRLPDRAGLKNNSWRHCCGWRTERCHGVQSVATAGLL